MSSSVVGGGAPADFISAEQFDAAAIRSGRTMQELADMIGVGRSMIYNYRDDGVSKPSTVQTVRRVMGVWLQDDQGNPYDGYSDRDLIRELERRLMSLRTKLDVASEGEGGAESS